MLSKLMKHEFRATARIMLPLYLILLVSAVFTNLFGRLTESYDVRILSILSGLFLSAFVVSIIGVTLMTFVFMIWRFYKNYMTDEGYLMFTLPTSTSQLIFSKVLVAAVWFLSTVVADILASLLMAFRLADVKELLQSFSQVFSYKYGEIAANLVGYCAEALVIFLLGCIASSLMIYAAISLGHSFASKKILLSVVFFFAFNIALQILGSVLMVVFIGNMDAFSYNYELTAGTVHLVLCIIIGIELLFAAIFYFVTYATLRRRLNLQ